MTLIQILSLRRTALAAACLMLTGLACAVPPPAAPTPATAASTADVHARVDALIGKAPCETQSQCHTVGVGAKPCGGPRAWRAWSEMKTDPAALAAAVEAEAVADKKASQADGLASDCMVTPQPQAVCRPGHDGGPKTCELGQGGADSAS